MGDHIPALLIGSDPAMLAELRIQLSGLDAATVVCCESSFEDGPRRARETPPEIIMIVMDGDARRALTVMEETSRAAPAAQLFALSRDDSAETIVKAMRAGASEFLNLPLEPGQVLKALIKIIALRRLTSPAAAGEIWTVYSPKGGAGVTTLAANLAMELHSRGKSTCLVDLDFQAGDLALFLNLTPTYTMVDIALNFRRLDSVFLQGTLTRHPSGLYLLAAAPHTGSEAETIPAEQVRGVLELLKSMYDVVVVDTPRALGEGTLAGLTAATRIFLLLELTLPFLRGYRRTLDLLESLEVPKERVDVVLAKGGMRSAVSLEEARKAVELTVNHTLPRDEETALAAANRGVPLAEIKSNSPLRKAIVDMVETAMTNSQNGQEVPKARRKGLFGGLFAS